MSDKERSAYIRECLEEGRLEKGEIDKKVSLLFGCSRPAARAARLREEKKIPDPDNGDDPDMNPKWTWFQDNSQVRPDENPDLFLIESKSKHKAYWRKSDNQYLFEIHFGASRRKVNSYIEVFDIPANQIQWLLQEYVHRSVGGRGKTQRTICREFGVVFDREMQHEVLVYILRALGVDKNSRPVAPHRYLPEYGEADKHIVRSIRVKREAAVEKKLRETDIEYLTKRNVELLEALQEKESIIEALHENHQPIDIDFSVTSQSPSMGLAGFHVLHLFSDWHVGATEYTTKYLELDLINQLDHFHDVLNLNIDGCTQIYAGDLLDGVMGDMHAGQAQHQYLTGAEQMRLSARKIEVIEKWIYDALPHPEGSQWSGYVTGNHDRVSKSYKDDPERVVGQAVQMWAEDITQGYTKWLKPERFSSILSTTIKSTQILVYHGDKQPDNWRKLLWTHLDKKCDYHLLISGHKHAPELKVSEDLGVMVVRIGSPLDKDNYAKENLGLGSRSSKQVLLIGEKGPQLPGQLLLKRSL